MRGAEHPEAQLCLSRMYTLRQPGGTGRHPRCAVTGVIVGAVGALDITPRANIPSVHALPKGLSRDQRTNLQNSYTMDDTPTHPSGKLRPGSDMQCC
jgi:hypothetical protein